MTDRELMQQLVTVWDNRVRWKLGEVVQAMRERLAQRERPRREWVGMTDRDIEEIARYQDEHGSGPWHRAFARAIEAKLREKN